MQEIIHKSRVNRLLICCDSFLVNLNLNLNLNLELYAGWAPLLQTDLNVIQIVIHKDGASLNSYAPRSPKIFVANLHLAWSLIHPKVTAHCIPDEDEGDQDQD